MKLTDETKKQIMDGLLEKFNRIADRDYQKRVWIRGEGPEWDDFDETVCQFFDIGEPVLRDYKQFNFTERQHHLLSKFQDEFDHFCQRHNRPSEFVDSKEWKEITEMAREVLHAFNHKSVA